MSEPTQAQIAAHEITLRDGAHYVFRSVRADDAPRLRDMFARASEEDRRFRCFGAIHDFAADMTRRLMRLDPAADVALAAVTPPEHEPEEILGVAHLALSPQAKDAAEFDILVRADFKQRGLGYRLMTEILSCARQRGLETITGAILRDNYAMLQMTQELGFVIQAVEDDIVRVKARLAQGPVLGGPGPSPA